MFLDTIESSRTSVVNMASTEVENLDILEERVRKLEEKIFGPLPKDAEYPEVRLQFVLGMNYFHSYLIILA